MVLSNHDCPLNKVVRNEYVKQNDLWICCFSQVLTAVPNLGKKSTALLKKRTYPGKFGQMSQTEPDLETNFANWIWSTGMSIGSDASYSPIISNHMHHGHTQQLGSQSHDFWVVSYIPGGVRLYPRALLQSILLMKSTYSWKIHILWASRWSVSQNEGLTC